jgi:hypothetical protein
MEISQTTKNLMLNWTRDHFIREQHHVQVLGHPTDKTQAGHQGMMLTKGTQETMHLMLGRQTTNSIPCNPCRQGIQP